MTPSAPGKRVIPFGGWVAAGIVFLLGFLFFSVIFIRENKAPGFIKLLFPILLPMILAGYTLLIGYIYGDARRRGMRYVMWTLLAIFLFNGIGIILYFILREPLAGVLFALRHGRTAQPRVLPALRGGGPTRLPGLPPYHSGRLDSLRLVRKSSVTFSPLWGTIPSTP